MRKICVLFAVVLLSIAGSACEADNYETDESDYDSVDTSIDPTSHSFPEGLRDDDYDGNNGSEGEAYCDEINSPDMESCQRAFNNFDRNVNGG